MVLKAVEPRIPDGAAAPRREVVEDPWSLPRPRLHSCYATRLRYRDLLAWAVILHQVKPFTISSVCRLVKEWYGVRLSQQAVQPFVARLIRAGYLRRIGSVRRGRWKRRAYAATSLLVELREASL